MIKRTLAPAITLAASLAGLAYIADHEGTGPTTTQGGQTVAQAYADPAHGWAVPTICHGRTLACSRASKPPCSNARPGSLKTPGANAPSSPAPPPSK